MIADLLIAVAGPESGVPESRPQKSPNSAIPEDEEGHYKNMTKIILYFKNVLKTSVDVGKFFSEM